MLKLRNQYILLLAGLLLAFASGAFAAGPMVINPGNPQTVCSGDSVILGGNPTASGGTAPYTFSWAPATNMNNPADSNPHVKVTTTTTYTVTVIDNSGNRQIDSVTITVDPVVNVTAGPDATICFYDDSATIGLPSNPAADTYVWSPSTGLSCPTCPTTVAKPSSTTTYTLNANDGTCSNTSTVTVTVLPPPVVTATSPVTIHRGESVTLGVNGLVSNFTWTPNSTLTGGNTATPTATPNTTTTYTVIGRDANGCLGFDTVTVDVINDSLLIFYNTFTPNGDGINDTWYIGNIDLFPNNEVVVYNRYGKVVYRANGYLNQWNGTSLGTNLPDATYYYLVYTGTGQTYKGSITIIRQPH